MSQSAFETLLNDYREENHIMLELLHQSKNEIKASNILLQDVYLFSIRVSG